MQGGIVVQQGGQMMQQPMQGQMMQQPTMQGGVVMMQQPVQAIDGRGPARNVMRCNGNTLGCWVRAAAAATGAAATPKTKPAEGEGGVICHFLSSQQSTRFAC
jgi:hypothetical protein